ncbi:hypothetical protein HNQ07_001628 [Deinococcus metalli]|uniref:Uncharacterized protein n=1 Tax=Deinococcus metalli TaxID=1141878 RepID=A0A7W8KFQ2_9DEIO|nr:hypothetical protein [Deinococcus metalli]MBB5376171.1 hypothetical protein [Deinococcus metalli]GHF40254.1 hypothetical protein GCM10017781_16090 [Deinococcus metalli]
MPKAGLYALLAILGFALCFAFLPSGTVAGSGTGAVLSGVTFRLYPSRDADAVWSFAAQQVSSDPVAGETRLTGLSGGQRTVKERDPRTNALTGRERLDARLDAPDLTIDDQDNMTTRQARITLVNECADIDLKGSAAQPVKIEQGQGFSAPVAEVRSPLLDGHYEKLRMRFDFYIEDADNEHSTTSSNLDTTERCVNGKRVNTPAGT